MCSESAIISKTFFNSELTVSGAADFERIEEAVAGRAGAGAEIEDGDAVDWAPGRTVDPVMPFRQNKR